jgi:hypothetical protein
VPDLPILPRLALSIRQPWAYCILHLGKPVENRDWSTRIRGPICVHAAKGMTQQEWLDGLYTVRAVGDVTPWPEGQVFPAMKELPRGGIVGTVDIVDVVEDYPSPWFFGHYGFVLANPKPCEFIPLRGQLGFFDWRKNLESESNG